MCDNLTLIVSRSVGPTEYTFLFGFSIKNLLQRGIRQAFKDKTGIAIDYQNGDDLYGIMRMVFINNSGDHYSQVNEQVKAINVRVISTALSQIQTGVSQYIAYNRDIDSISVPLDQPVNTSTVGKKIDFNNKIGIN